MANWTHIPRVQSPTWTAEPPNSNSFVTSARACSNSFTPPSVFADLRADLDWAIRSAAGSGRAAPGFRPFPPCPAIRASRTTAGPHRAVRVRSWRPRPWASLPRCDSQAGRIESPFRQRSWAHLTKGGRLQKRAETRSWGRRRLYSTGSALGTISLTLGYSLLAFRRMVDLAFWSDLCRPVLHDGPTHHDLFITGFSSRNGSFQWDW